MKPDVILLAHIRVCKLENLSIYFSLVRWFNGGCDSVRLKSCSTLSTLPNSHVPDPQLVMSSDQLGSIQQPVVTVDFDLSQDGQRKMESIELSKEELAKFVTSLEAASKVRMYKVWALL